MPLWWSIEGAPCHTRAVSTEVICPGFEAARKNFSLLPHSILEHSSTSQGFPGFPLIFPNLPFRGYFPPPLYQVQHRWNTKKSVTRSPANVLLLYNTSAPPLLDLGATAQGYSFSLSHFLTFCPNRNPRLALITVYLRQMLLQYNKLYWFWWVNEKCLRKTLNSLLSIYNYWKVQKGRLITTLFQNWISLWCISISGQRLQNFCVFIINKYP